MRAESHPSKDSSIHPSIHPQIHPSIQPPPSTSASVHPSNLSFIKGSLIALIGPRLTGRNRVGKPHTTRPRLGLAPSSPSRSDNTGLSLTPGPAAGFRRTLCLLRMVFLPPHSSPYNFIPAPSTKPLHAKTNAVLLTSITIATRALSIHRSLAAANSSLRIHALCGERQVRGGKFS